ncbi:Disco-interacting protein 2 homolog, putative [Brugia malayi]|uniref:Disco-interacting protein 2 homolog, putative n=1 Tax=Brugia malayi TaxID=6279 RepID=A0A4E9FHI2_BRUMA|nr:Disco-interacting protein 2 homolog, putative [Brugia malayi]VIO95952.1 Disco-interacting protein 2 homolog, putative [Brugia malayi]
MVDAIDISSLPSDVRERLAQLDLELSEGDITQKGYDKKKQLLLGPYLRIKKDGNKVASSPSTKAQRKHQRRLTRDESRFHSEIHAEAVQQALAEYSEGKKEKPNILPPLKRRGTEIKRERHRASDSSSEDDSMFGSTDRSKGTSSTLSLNEQRKKNLANGSQKPDASSPPPDITATALANDAVIRKVFQDRRKQDRNIISENERNAMKKVADADETVLKTDIIYANDVAGNDIAITNITNQDYQNAVVLSSLSALKPVRVSLKIQQLVHSLQVS